MGKGKGKDDKRHKPRPFNCCEMPIIDPCPHSFCLVERTKREGQNPELPKGLPWSTGLLKEMPGTGPKYIPYHFPETTSSSVARTRKQSPSKGSRQKQAAKLKTVMDVCDQMMFFLKIIMLANELLAEEKGGEAAGAEDTKPPGDTKPVEKSAPPTEEPPPTEEVPPPPEPES